MIGKVICEKDGTRKFERVGKWTILEDTLISKNNRFAEFADNYGSNDKLRITIFGRGSRQFPMNKFKCMDDVITLKDYSLLSRYDSDSRFFIEINKTGDKVRLYREV